MKKIFLLQTLFLFILAGSLSGQVVLGSDTSQHIKVTTSSNYHPPYWTQTATGDKTINAIGLEGPLMEASRFLSQATLGADLETIKHVAEEGIEAWTNEQIEIPPSLTLERLEQVFAEVIEWYFINGGDPEEVATRPYWTIFNYTWWEKSHELTRPAATASGISLE